MHMKEFFSSLLRENTAKLQFLFKFISHSSNTKTIILSVQLGVWFQILFLVCLDILRMPNSFSITLLEKGDHTGSRNRTLCTSRISKYAT